MAISSIPDVLRTKHLKLAKRLGELASLIREIDDRRMLRAISAMASEEERFNATTLLSAEEMPINDERIDEALSYLPQQIAGVAEALLDLGGCELLWSHREEIEQALAMVAIDPRMIALGKTRSATEELKMLAIQVFFEIGNLLWEQNDPHRPFHLAKLMFSEREIVQRHIAAIPHSMKLELCATLSELLYPNEIQERETTVRQETGLMGPHLPPEVNHGRNESKSDSGQQGHDALDRQGAAVVLKGNTNGRADEEHDFELLSDEEILERTKPEQLQLLRSAVRQVGSTAQPKHVLACFRTLGGSLRTNDQYACLRALAARGEYDGYSLKN